MRIAVTDLAACSGLRNDDWRNTGGIEAPMSDLGQVSRRLVAVFAADVEGYSRLMGTDEVGTLKGLTERRAILDRLIADHRGRIANTAGDSVLAEFGSAVDAVQCAVEAQSALALMNLMNLRSTDVPVPEPQGLNLPTAISPLLRRCSSVVAGQRLRQSGSGRSRYALWCLVRFESPFGRAYRFTRAIHPDFTISA